MKEWSWVSYTQEEIKKLVNVLFNNEKNDKDKLSNELNKLEKNSKINLRRVRMNKWY